MEDEVRAYSTQHIIILGNLTFAKVKIMYFQRLDTYK